MSAHSRVFVVGQGEVGRRLADAFESAGLPLTRVTRHEGWNACRDPLRAGLRVLCMREHDLPDAFEELAAVPREALVLVQNGFLEAALGNLEGVSRGLIWFTSKGSFFEELQESVFFGPAAHGVTTALARGGLAVRSLPEGPGATRAMIEKGLWNGVVGLPLGVHGLSLGEYLSGHEDEWRALMREGASAAGAFYGTALSADEACATLLRTTSSLGWVKTSAKALAWRNGAISWMGRRCEVPTPTHDRLLEAAGYDPAAGPATLARKP